MVKNKPIIGSPAVDSNEGTPNNRLYKVDAWIEPGLFVTIMDGLATPAIVTDRIDGVAGHEFHKKFNLAQQIYTDGEVWAKEDSTANTNPKSRATNKGSRPGYNYDGSTDATAYLEKLG